MWPLAKSEGGAAGQSHAVRSNYDLVCGKIALEGAFESLVFDQLSLPDSAARALKILILPANYDFVIFLLKQLSTDSDTSRKRNYSQNTENTHLTQREFFVIRISVGTLSTTSAYY